MVNTIEKVISIILIIIVFVSLFYFLFNLVNKDIEVIDYKFNNKLEKIEIIENKDNKLIFETPFNEIDDFIKVGVLCNDYENTILIHYNQNQVEKLNGFGDKNVFSLNGNFLFKENNCKIDFISNKYNSYEVFGNNKISSNTQFKGVVFMEEYEDEKLFFNTYLRNNINFTENIKDLHLICYNKNIIIKLNGSENIEDIDNNINIGEVKVEMEGSFKLSSNLSLNNITFFQSYVKINEVDYNNYIKDSYLNCFYN